MTPIEPSHVMSREAFLKILAADILKYPGATIPVQNTNQRIKAQQEGE